LSISNGYCGLLDFKSYLTPPGQSLSVDIADDTIIERIIERASRRFDDLCSRVFYPHVETVYYDIPMDDVLWFGDDLLEVISLTNGDGVAIGSSNYKFHPAREYPKYALQLTDVSSVVWQESSAGSSMQVIALAALWGYRQRYAQDGWLTGSTLNEVTGINAVELTFTVASGSLFAANQILRIDNELMPVDSVSGNDITVVKRGANGSTAAAHDNADTVYIWQYQGDISGVVLEIANIMYKSRYQPQAVEGQTAYTSAAVVVSPRSLPGWVHETLNKYRRRV
jgi:hypothetical protein